jgi:hypothetical protein
MSKYNKAIVAFLIAIVAFVRSFFGVDLGIDDATATAIVGAITTALVYWVPNRPN